VTRTLSLLRRQTPLGRPLSAVRILVTGGRVLVKDRFAAWEPATGQGTLDFEPAALSSNLLPAQLVEAEAPQADQDAGTLYSMALDLELSGHIEAAESAYQAVLEAEPEHPHARINLGRLLHQQNRFALAEACYRRVLQQDPENALAAFNLGVVLEDQKDDDGAVAAYRRTVAIDDSYADAHFNLSRLLEARGDQQAALRHLSRFRRLTKE